MINREKMDEFVKLLKKRQKHIRPYLKKNDIECYRIYHRNIHGIPLAIDVYQDCLHVSCFEGNTELDENDIDTLLETAGNILYIQEQNIFYKYREKLTDGGQYKKYASQGKELIVSENGLRFIVNLSDYLDTGLFLDHRITRGMVRQNAAGMRVLNLFAYTGSFTVYAAAGGAARTVTVDMSNTYLSWAKRNMELNLFTGPEHELLNDDVFSYLSEAGRKAARGQGGRFDIIILDPPTFSNSRKMDNTLDIQRDHPELINTCAGLLAADGTIIFSTNFLRFRLEKQALRGLHTEEITSQTIPEDFKSSRVHRCWLIRK